ncbi:uncharacterized protein LOC105710097 [Aotus nancymaae]|uniref:uncharacterized protein LOC105710097 n=1 Tax=Aotus nancymaae TaxID=37293 RepID=UPI0030FE66C2
MATGNTIPAVREVKNCIAERAFVLLYWPEHRKSTPRQKHAKLQGLYCWRPRRTRVSPTRGPERRVSRPSIPVKSPQDSAAGLWGRGLEQATEPLGRWAVEAAAAAAAEREKERDPEHRALFNRGPWVKCSAALASRLTAQVEVERVFMQQDIQPWLQMLHSSPLRRHWKLRQNQIQAIHLPQPPEKLGVQACTATPRVPDPGQRGPPWQGWWGQCGPGSPGGLTTVRPTADGGQCQPHSACSSEARPALLQPARVPRTLGSRRDELLAAADLRFSGQLGH